MNSCLPSCPPCFSSTTKFVICRNKDYVAETGLCNVDMSKTVFPENIKVGDYVQTLSTGFRMDVPVKYTRVVQNTKSVGKFKFIRIELESLEGEKSIELEVTSEHQVIILLQDNEKWEQYDWNNWQRESNFAENAIVVQAHEVNRGMLLATLKGARKVVDTRFIYYPVKYSVETWDGTALGSGVLTTTMCDGSIDSGSNLLEVISNYKATHQQQQEWGYH